MARGRRMAVDAQTEEGMMEAALVAGSVVTVGVTFGWIDLLWWMRR